MKTAPTLLLSILLPVGGHAATMVNDAALNDRSRGENWAAYGRTYDQQRFSPLQQITRSNVAKLSVDWWLDLPNDRGLASSPLVVDRVLYFVGTMNILRAVDAVSGRLLWEYDPKLADTAGDRLRVGWHKDSRGIAFWNGKVLLATHDGRLNAIDARTGREVWSTMTLNPEEPTYITAVPLVFKGKVLIGSGGADGGKTRGYVSAYDVETGKLAWRFYIVPGDPAKGFENKAMAMAAQTWTGEWWKLGGGGNVWHGYTYDPEFNAVYLGTGNGSPWNRRVRSPGGGDNLFLCSIVALDADTGEYRWHYQTTPGETWDYNSCMDIVLADLTLSGRSVKALLHAPKNGFFYVIDRATGRLLSADPFAPVNWASQIDLSTGRPVENPDARYPNGTALVTPTASGAHGWHAMSYNPGTGLVYIPVMYETALYSDVGIERKNWSAPDWRSGRVGDSFGLAYKFIAEGSSRSDGAGGSLQAWDPVARKIVWELLRPTSCNGGTMTTAGGLVFQGLADGHFVAYDGANGAELWRTYVGVGITAPPITYSLGGKQYVALLAGWGGGPAALGGPSAAALGWAYGLHPRRVIAFSLEGKATLPPSPPPFVPIPIVAPDFKVDEALAKQGAAEFGRCAGCHGPRAIAAGNAPDLRASAIPLHRETLTDVVRTGSRVAKGMPRFAQISDQELTAIQHYLRWEANEATSNPTAAK